MVPEPNEVPLHPTLGYQRQIAFVPNDPPFTVNVTDVPEQTEEAGLEDAEVGSVEIKLSVTPTV